MSRIAPPPPGFLPLTPQTPAESTSAAAAPAPPPGFVPVTPAATAPAAPPAISPAAFAEIVANPGMSAVQKKEVLDKHEAANLIAPAAPAAAPGLPPPPPGFVPSNPAPTQQTAPTALPAPDRYTRLMNFAVGRPSYADDLSGILPTGAEIATPAPAVQTENPMLYTDQGGYLHQTPAAHRPSVEELTKMADDAELAHRRAVSSWFERNGQLAQDVQTGDPGAMGRLRMAIQSDPLPTESLQYLPPDLRRAWTASYEENFKRPAMAKAAGAPEPAAYIPEHIAAWRTRASTGLGAVVGNTLKSGTEALHDVGGPDLRQWGERQAEEAQFRAQKGREAAQYIEEQLPQTTGGEIATGQIKFAGEVGASALTGDRKSVV